MKKEEIHAQIDEMRNCEFCCKDGLIGQRILNYIEANIADFIECYNEFEEKQEE